MTRVGLILFVLVGVVWLSFLNFVLPDPHQSSNDLLQDVRQEPQPISPWRR